MESLNALSDYQPKSVDGKVIVPAILSIFESFQFKFETMFSDMRVEFLNVCAERDVKIDKMNTEIFQLKKKVDVLEQRIEQNDSYERRDSVIISGKAVPPVQRDENCLDLTCQLVKEKLNVIISPSDISIAHRLGEKKATQGPDQRDIIIKFCRRNTKLDLVTASRKKKSPNFFINESLTPQGQTIAYILRKAKREFPNIVSGSTSLDGRNFVWVMPPNPTAQGAKSVRIAITTHDRLVEFCTKTLGKPLSHFVSNWTH